MAKLRLSSHKLNIEIDRHNIIDRQDRKCKSCNINDIEDEFHFVLVSPDYINLRNVYIPKYYSDRPGVLMFIELVQTKNTSLLINLSIYCIKDIRKLFMFFIIVLSEVCVFKVECFFHKKLHSHMFVC